MKCDKQMENRQRAMFDKYNNPSNISNNNCVVSEGYICLC